MTRPLLQIKNLTKRYLSQRGHITAVDGFSLDLFEGETVGLVGESGCGKSTVGKSILRLLEPTSGNIFFQNQEITSLEKRALKEVRKEMQLIFQDPYASLNPRMTVNEIIQEPLDIHKVGNKPSRKVRVEELLYLVGLNPSIKGRFPHEFSGGQRQRIGIARALALNPKLLVCDEPISALDVSIGAQIVNLLKSLQETFSLTVLFIAHDLAMVKHISDRVAVMHQGKLVELATSDQLFQHPQQEYTKQLLGAIPTPEL